MQAPDPASLVATADRTVVTRRPRASHRTSEPHELLPTLRMPPVEARALRRQASGTPDADAIAIGSGEIEIDASESSGARAPTPDVTPAIEIPPVVEAVAPVEPVAQSRDTQATVRVATVPSEGGTTVGMPPPRPVARLHRPPLPMPDVLRNGPKPAPRSERHAEPTPELVASSAAVPGEIAVIDTASLVLEMAEELSAIGGPASIEPEPTVEAPADLAVETPAVALREHAVVIAAAPVELDEPAPQPRRRGYAAIAIGLAASVAAAIWWLAPAPQPTEQIETAFAPLGDQLAFVAEQTPEPEPIAKAEPTPAIEPEPVVPEPAIAPPVVPAVEPPTLVADAALIPTPTEPAGAEEPEPAIEVVEPEAPVAAAAPKPAPKPKHAKSSAKKSKAKSKPKPAQQPTKVAAAPPPPAAKTVASLDPAALLREAEKAYAEGRYGTALRNAQRSLAGRNDPRAQRIVALSACKLKREGVAKSAFERLPLGQRRSVRNTCKDAGIKL